MSAAQRSLERSASAAAAAELGGSCAPMNAPEACFCRKVVALRSAAVPS